MLANNLYQEISWDDARTAWLTHAHARRPHEMVLTTRQLSGEAWESRVVLLRDWSTGCVFYTDYRSTKSAQISRCPLVYISFWWEDLTLIVAGAADRLSAEASAAYFQTRPFGSQCAARASCQSHALPAPDWLAWCMAREVAAQAERGVCDCPAYWGGIMVRPRQVWIRTSQESVTCVSTEQQAAAEACWGEHADYVRSQMAAPWVGEHPAALWAAWSAEAFVSPELLCLLTGDGDHPSDLFHRCHTCVWEGSRSMVCGLLLPAAAFGWVGQAVQLLCFHSRQERQCRCLGILQERSDGRLCVMIEQIEFWQGRPSRLHDRWHFTYQAETADWRRTCLYP